MTKVAGQAASYSPSFAGVLASLSATVSGQAIGAGLLTVSFAFSGSAALGQALPSQCSAAPSPLAAGGTVTCVAAAPEVINGITTTVDDRTLNIGNTDTSTAVNNAAGDGVEQVGAGAQTLNIINSGSSVTGAVDGVDIEVTSGAGELTIVSEGTITGGQEGIFAQNNGTGDLSIVTTGEVTGSTYDGIDATNGASAGDLTVQTSGIVMGSFDGIEATNNGTGALTITATGDVTAVIDNALEVENFGTDLTITTAGTITGGGGDGIYALNYSTGALTITATGNVTADDDGIYAFNDGTGALTITATGDVTGVVSSGSFSNGILARNNSAGTDLSVATDGTVTGGDTAIYTNNNGTGALTVTARGDVSGDVVDGINAINGAAGTDTLITTTGTVTGFENGIQASNIGAGALTITSTGDIRGVEGGGLVAVSSGQDALTIDVGNVSGGTNADSFGIDARTTAISAGDIEITSTGTVSGERNGIFARQNGTGALTISVNDIMSNSNYGITAENTATSTGDIEITSTGTVIGDNAGITAANVGTGALRITATADVIGTSGDGVFVLNRGTDLSITTESAVSGNDDGISATNDGTGALTITATGDVTGVVSSGSFSNGIFAQNNTTGTNLSVTTDGTVTGGDTAIYANNNGTGALTLTATGDVSGDVVDGIIAINGSTGTDLAITSEGTVTGFENGIQATNNGTGALVITSTGDIRGVEGGGLVAVSSGQDALTIDIGNVSGGTNADSFGIDARATAISAGDIEITSTGTVSGEENGIFARQNGTGALTISVNDIMSNSNYGITAENTATSTGDIEITSTGTVTGGDNNDGIGAVQAGAGNLRINAVNVYGNDGIEAGATSSSSGDVFITSTGSVEATVVGIRSFQNGSGDLTVDVTDVSAVTGNGVNANNEIDGGDITVVARGTVSGGYNGLYVSNLGAGANTSIAVNNVSGQNAIGIDAENAAGTGKLTISATGLVQGATEGISATQNGTGALTITATGDVSGDAVDGIIAINGSTGTDLTITSDGTVTGGENGIQANNIGTGELVITATGGVNGAGGNGITGFDAFSGTNLTITTESNVLGSINGIVAGSSGTGPLTIITAGDVTGTASDGIRATNIRTDTVIATNGITSGGQIGIYANHGGSGALVISALNDVTGGSADGIYAINGAAGTDTLITTTGTVTGSENGIQASNIGAGALTITSTGDVRAVTSSGLVAVNSGQDALSIDVGNVSGGTNADSFGIDARTTAISAGDIEITSTGTVSGEENGIFAQQNGTGALTITSTGAISGGGNGITADNRATGTGLAITAAGLVTGGQDGIEARNSGTGALTITATGGVTGTENGIEAISDGGGLLDISVNGAVTGGRQFGIVSQTGVGGRTKITANAGATVSSLSGNAIFNDDGDSDTIVATDASVIGEIVLSGGSDNLLFDGGNFSDVTLFDGGDDLDSLSFLGSSGTLSGLRIQNFESVVAGQGSRISFDDNTLTTDSAIITTGGLVNVSGLFTFDTALLASTGALSTQNAAASDRVKVTGDFSGGGDLSIDVDFAAGTGDTLVIDGDVVGAPTRVEVADISTGPYADNDVLIVDVGGDVTVDDFVLGNSTASSGIFDIDLAFRNNQFFLSIGGVNGTGATYEATPSILLNGFTDLAPLRQRTAGRRWLNAQDSDHVSRGLAFLPGLIDSEPRQGAWVQFRGGNQDVQPTSSSSGLTYDSTTFGIQAGVDVLALDGNNGRWIFGATAQFGSLNANVSNASGSGNVDATGYGIGATATWYSNSGTYVDIQGQVNQIETDITSSSGGTLVSNETSTAYAASVEVGHRIPVSSYGSLIPQAQLVFGSVSGDTFTDDTGNVVELGTNSSSIGRLGLAYEYTFSNAAKGQDTRAYTVFNVVQDFSGTQDVRVNRTTLSSRNDRTSAEIGIGGVYSLEDSVSLFAEGAYRSSLSGNASNNNSVSLTAGVQLLW